MWQTNAVAAARRRRGDADRLALLPGRARGAARRARGRGLRARRPARHARRLRPPARAARLPGPGARRGRVDRASASTASPGAAQRELRDYDAEHYVERPGAAVARPGAGAPGARRYLGAGRASELELHPAEGHTADGTGGLRALAAACSCVGDYLSEVEIPWISDGGSLEDYRATLARLAPLVEAAETSCRATGPARPRHRAAAAGRGRGLPGRAGARRRRSRALPQGRDTSRTSARSIAAPPTLGSGSLTDGAGGPQQAAATTVGF